jgi:hypothetical protein
MSRHPTEILWDEKQLRDEVSSWHPQGAIGVWVKTFTLSLRLYREYENLHLSPQSFLSLPSIALTESSVSSGSA